VKNKKDFFKKSDRYKPSTKKETPKKAGKKEFSTSRQRTYTKETEPLLEQYKLSKGLIQIYTGDGKGKTCTVIGLTLRASGAGLKTGFFQFFKRPFSSEIKVLRELKNIHFYTFASHYYQSEYITKEEIKRFKADFKNVWKKTLSIIEKNSYDIIILDEILVALRDGFLSENELLDFIQNKNRTTELIITGRDITDKLTEVADLITELKKIKHPFPDIKARKGIDF